MKKKLVSILCIVMLFALVLSGCSNEKDALIGEWEGKLDVTDYINDILVAEDELMGQYVEIRDFSIIYTISFNEDDTYSLDVDKRAFDDTVDNMIDDVVAGLMDYLEDMIEAEGLNMTVDELMELSGISMDALLEESFPADSFDEIVEALEMEGYFDVDDGKLLLSESLSTKPDPNVYERYTLEGDTLTIDEGTAEVEEIDGFDVYPMVLKKIG